MLSHSQRCDVKWPLALQDAASTPVTEGIGGTWVALSYICSFTGISGQKDGVYSFSTLLANGFELCIGQIFKVKLNHIDIYVIHVCMCMCMCMHNAMLCVMCISMMRETRVVVVGQLGACLNVMFQTTERNYVVYDSLLLQLLIIRHPQLRVREHRPRSLHVLEPLGRLRLIRGGVG